MKIGTKFENCMKCSTPKTHKHENSTAFATFFVSLAAAAFLVNAGFVGVTATRTYGRTATLKLS